MLKWTYGHSVNYYKVATLSESYLTTTGITMQSLQSIRHFLLPELTKKRSEGWTYGRGDPNYRKALLLTLMTTSISSKAIKSEGRTNEHESLKNVKT